MATRTSQSHAAGVLSLSSSSASSSSTSSFVVPTPGPSRVASAPGLSRQASSMSVETPVATASVVNKTANGSTSLYQNCLTARAMMRRVPGFEEGAWIQMASQVEEEELSTPKTPHTSTLLDPVSNVLQILRLGSSLCYLFNAILLEPRTPPNLDALPRLPQGKTWEHISKIKVNTTHDLQDLQSCKRSTAWFVMAVRTELGWGTPEDTARGNEEMFMVNMLYDQNTNATVKVISNVLRLLNLLAALGVLMPPKPDDDSALNNATGGELDDRGKVVREILDSERKYVQDLEVLQMYQRALQQAEILPADQIRNLFMNLDGLVDFQRRFLIGVEANARLAADEQRFGHLFMNMEHNFSCYQTFCANFASASQLAQDELPALSAKSDILDPSYELPAFLIKPIQRICKYPMLLQALIKNTPKNSQFYKELKDGHAAITRVVDAVNETTRQRENELAVEELRGRVEDWKGHDVRSFGPLVLEDMFPVIKNESEREYHVYLFEKIILCCKEVGAAKNDKKNSKSNSILKKPASARKKTTLQLKGRIFITNVLSAAQPPRTTSSWPWLLQVTWRGDQTDEFFSIKCRNEDQLRKWQAAITKAVDEATADRKRRQHAHLSASVRRGITSPQSQFPSTPLSELGPMSAGYGPRTNGDGHPYSARNFEEDDGDGAYRSEDAGGRSTPMGRRPGVAHRSMPAERSGESHHSRPRAQTTEESSGQWRRDVDGKDGSTPLPPVPRTSDHGSQPSSLRSSSSSRNLRHKQSHEWGSAGFGRSDDEGVRTAPLLRQGSQASLPVQQQQQQPYGLPPQLRNRSASSPNIYQVEGAMAQSAQWGHIPQVPSSRAQRPNGVGHAKRSSDCSSITDRSSDDSGRTPATAASSPASTTVPNSVASSRTNGRYSNGPAPPNSSVRFKLRSGDDQYVIVALPTISFGDLQDKVVKKLKNCGVKKDGEVRMRYEDEEGDKILLTADDDIAMAIDWLRQSGADFLTLYVD